MWSFFLLLLLFKKIHSLVTSRWSIGNVLTNTYMINKLNKEITSKTKNKYFLILRCLLRCFKELPSTRNKNRNLLKVDTSATLWQKVICLCLLDPLRNKEEPRRGCFHQPIVFRCFKITKGYWLIKQNFYFLL